MKIEFTFLHVDSSEALKSHAAEKLGHLVNFENKPMDVHVLISHQRHECTVELNVLEGRRKFQATATSHDYYHAVDKAIEKLKKQLIKGKRKMKNHRHATRADNVYYLFQKQTRELEHEFETEFDDQVLKKSA